jgi:hypothetical protein
MDVRKHRIVVILAEHQLSRRVISGSPDAIALLLENLFQRERYCGFGVDYQERSAGPSRKAIRRLNRGEWLEADSIPAGLADGKTHSTGEHTFMGQAMLGMSDAIDSVARNDLPGPVTLCQRDAHHHAPEILPSKRSTCRSQLLEIFVVENIWRGAKDHVLHLSATIVTNRKRASAQEHCCVFLACLVQNMVNTAFGYFVIGREGAPATMFAATASNNRDQTASFLLNTSKVDQ